MKHQITDRNNEQHEANSVAQRLITSRYGRKAEKVLNEYFANHSTTAEFVALVIIHLQNLINNPFEYDGYQIPLEVEQNRYTITRRLKEEIAELSDTQDLEELKQKLYSLFVSKNFLIKYSTRQWLLLNSGMALEFSKAEEKLDSRFLEWLSQEFDTDIGDLVVQRHVISNQERELLKTYGVDVPYGHWDVEYYRQAMRLIQQIVRSNADCKGIISDGSWVYNPKLYELAEDGEPYASFTFLADNKLSGHRFFYMTAKPGNEQENQYFLATKSPRRKQLIEEGKLTVDVYMVFYPREELLRAEI